jgi:NAD(P)-dependent dehydrogenase (short-subunit alcohol dehydrogenase family)
MNPTVLITGTSSGIGKASTQLFANQGWNVVATMRNPESNTDFSDLDNVLVTRLDVQNQNRIAQSVEAGVARFGKIDVLINNAGYGLYGLFEAMTQEDIQKQFDVNVFGVMNVTRAILPHFRAKKEGLILNVSSGAGLFTLPMISLYCASKFALEGFSEALAYELASQNIGVKLVLPHGGVTSTNFSERLAREAATDATLTDYDEFVARTNAAFASMTATSNMSSDDVARVIYNATTDGTDQLRYLVGDDSRGFVKAKYELPDQEFINFMRARFPVAA